MIKGVLFDLDGTLVDTVPFIVSSFKFVCTKHGIEVITREKIQALGGASLRTTYEQYHPDYDFDALTQDHVDWQAANTHMVTAFPDTLQTLDWLLGMGIERAVVTSRLKNTQTLMELAGIDSHFAVVITAEDVTHHKPHPESVLLALDRLSLRPEEVLMVGDMSVDVEVGKNAGVITIGVASGFSTASELAAFGADHVCSCLAEIVPIIQRLNTPPG